MPGQKDGWKDRQKDGRMDRHNFIGPIHLPPRVQKKFKKKQQFVLLKTNFRFDQSCRKNVNIDQIFSLIFYGLT